MGTPCEVPVPKKMSSIINPKKTQNHPRRQPVDADSPIAADGAKKKAPRGERSALE